MTEKIEDVSLLKNAPLKEVIFELHWDLDYITEENIQIDRQFEQAVLNFSNICKSSYEQVEILKPQSMPYTAYVHKVTHRFFKNKNQYPLFQFGPGVFTVNDNNKDYCWSDFKSLISEGLGYLKQSYSTQPVLSKIELRFVDAVSVNVLGKENKFSFLKKHLNVNAEGYVFVDGELNEINFAKRFSVDNEMFLNIMIATGIEGQTKEDGIIWHTYINNKRWINWDEIDSWIETAHEIASKTFKKMVSDELYQYFRR